MGEQQNGNHSDELAMVWGPPAVAAVLAFLFLLIGAALDIDILKALGVVAVIAAIVVLVVQLQRRSSNSADTGSPVQRYSTTPISDSARRQLLEQHLSEDVARSRSRVESVTPYSAIVVSGQRVNHILHLLVSVLLCGFWLPIWLIIAMGGGEKRHVLTVDQCGNYSKS